MRKFLPLLLCLLLSIFSAARATKPNHHLAPNAKVAEKEPTGQEADVKTLLKSESTDEEVTSDNDDNMDVPSNEDGEDMNDDDGADAPGDEDTGDDDSGDDDQGDDGGGDKGE